MKIYNVLKKKKLVLMIHMFMNETELANGDE